MSIKPEQSTREFIGIERINNKSLTTRSGELVFFAIRPANLSTLSEDSVMAKIYALMTVLKGVAEIEMLCVNSRENFDGNKRYLKARIDGEDNPAIRRLLEQDTAFLDRVQAQTATAREFFIILRQAIKTISGKPSMDESGAEVQISRVEKSLSDQGFAVKRADAADLKKLLAVYFEQNVTTDRFEDFDGERWTEAAI
jgi:hypothetical protein